MVMLKRKTVILAKTETTYGTDPTPTAGDNAILALNAEVKEVREPIERNINISTLSNKPSLLGVESAEVTFSVEIKGSGSAGTAPRLGALLKACSFSETVLSSTSVTYVPASSSQSSVTLYVYVDGVRHIVKGARGSVKINMTAGELGTLEFSFVGLYTARTSTAIVSGTYDTPDPVPCKSCTFSYNSKTTLVAKTFDLDMANTTVRRRSLGASTGIESIEVTARKPILTLDIEAQIQTSYDFRGDMLDTEREVSVDLGSTAGNICTITVSKYNIINIEYGDDEGILIENLTGECAVDSGDDEVEIVFT